MGSTHHWKFKIDKMGKTSNHGQIGIGIDETTYSGIPLPAMGKEYKSCAILSFGFWKTWRHRSGSRMYVPGFHEGDIVDLYLDLSKDVGYGGDIYGFSFAVNGCNFKDQLGVAVGDDIEYCMAVSMTRNCSVSLLEYDDQKQ